MTLCYIKSLELPSSHGQTIQGPLELYSYVKAGYEQGEFHPWTQSRISTETGNCQDVHTQSPIHSVIHQFYFAWYSMYWPFYLLLLYLKMFSLEKVSLTTLKDYDICHDNITSWHVMTTFMTFQYLYADTCRPIMTKKQWKKGKFGLQLYLSL